MRSWSVPLARIFGVEVRLHLTFILLLVYVWMTEAAAPRHPTGTGRAFALAGIVFGAVLLHELGHALAARHTGRRARSVVLLPIGGITLMDETADTDLDPRRELRIALAGPVINFVCAALIAGIAMAVVPGINLSARPVVYSGHLLRSAVWINICLAAFNLVPAYPLDAGRVLRAWFLRQMDFVHATRRAVTVGQVFAMMLMLAGMWNLWLTLLGIFLFMAAQIEERSAVFHSVLESVRMEDVMLTDFATLSPADTLEDALNKAVHSLQDDFPVIRGTDMVGVISKQRILESLRAQGNGYVQAVMNRVFEVSQRDDSLASAFRKITSRGATIIPVVEDEHLVGIVTLQNLMHSMSLLAESKKLRRAESPAE